MICSVGTLSSIFILSFIFMLASSLLLPKVHLRRSYRSTLAVTPGLRSLTTLRAKSKGPSAGKGKKSTAFVSIEDAENDLWQLEPVLDILRKGGVGVIPTDTCYSFVTSVTSREGMERLMSLKGISGKKKPLSVLCKDLSTISKYTSDLSDQKWVYKLLKTTLPGPFTYILPASKEFPRLILESDRHVKRWKRKEVGVKMPHDLICAYVMESLDSPLICGSVPEDAEDELGILSISSIVAAEEAEDSDSDEDQESGSGSEEDESGFDRNYVQGLVDCKWFPQVDFVVENGPRGLLIDETSDSKKKKRVSLLGGLSTIVDLTTGRPVILRQGRGSLDVDSIQT